MATPVRPRGRQVNLVQAVALLAAFALIAGIGGVLAAGLVLPAVAVASTTTTTAATAFDDLPSQLKEEPLSEKSVMLAADGTVLATFYAENRIVVPLDKIAPVMQQAVIAVEDKRFYQHGGIDPAGMLRAFAKNALTDDLQGASTLTQQYVKNVLVEAGQRDNDAAAIEAAREHEGTAGLSRKLREAKIAIALEKKYPKQKILENYLNIAQFGSSVWGVEAASQYYFSKPAAKLTYLEAATLAGVTQSPSKWDPARNPDDSQRRRNIVLGLMKAQKIITPAEYQAGIATKLPATLKIQPTALTCAAAGTVVAGSGYFCDYVTKVIKNNAAFGKTPADRTEQLYRGGLTITTTLDPREQALADAEVKRGVPVDDPSGVASAISVVEPGTGKIVAMAQNRTYNPRQSTVARETSVNYNTDFSYGGSSGFAPGSTFKPFTLTEWLKNGHSLRETVNGQERTWNLKQFTTCDGRGPNKAWKLRNAEGNGRQMSVLDATKNSVNNAYADMASQLNICSIMQTASSMGVHTAGRQGVPPRPFASNPANVIGTDEIAPLTMAAAFATFASGGTFCEPIAITKVVDANGKELPVPPANCRTALEPRIASAVNYALTNVWKGTARTVGAPKFPAAGKTGTTSENENTWFVGYTPIRAAAVWVGFPDRTHPMQNMRIAGHSYYRGHQVYGASIAAPTWKRFMTQAVVGLSTPGFGKIGTKELNGELVYVPNVVGQSERSAKLRLTDAGFNVIVETDRIGSGYPSGAVAAQSPSGKAPQGSLIRLQISNGQPPASADGGNQGGPGNGGDPGHGNGGKGKGRHP
jgi:membrane peptidoglycan carboxypeptidase